MAETDYEDLFMKGVDEVSLHSESDLEDSMYYLEQERLKKQMDEAKNRAKMQKSLILRELKEQDNKKNILLKEYEQEAQDLAKITRGNQFNVIDENVIRQIRQQVAIKTAAEMPSVEKADQAIMKKVVQIKTSSTSDSQINFKKRKQQQEKQRMKEQQEAIELKQEKMRVERELVEMAKEDALSLKYEREYLSNLLAGRNYQPNIRGIYRKLPPIRIDLPEPPMTYTNLASQRNNDENVHSKHSEVMALRALAKRGTARNTTTKQVNIVKVSFVKNTQESAPPEELGLKLVDIQKKSSEIIKGSALAQNVSDRIREYFKTVSSDIRKLQQISSKYKPRFAKNFLETDQINLNMDVEDRTQSPNGKPLEKFITDLENHQKLKQISITFERLKDVKGISSLKSIEYAKLQFNMLESVEEIAQCAKLIQVNVSNNNLTLLKGLNQLKWLRVLDVEKNKITKIEPFVQNSLELLNLKDNSIKVIQGLQNAKYLRRLVLSHNMIQKISGLSELAFLDQLDLSHNKIVRLENLNQCLLLRKLDLSHNRISEYGPDPLIMMFLNSLKLSSNCLQNLGHFILPSLQQLYVQNNKICASNKDLVYLPSLKLLNFDDNRLQHLGPVWKAVRYSHKSLEFLKYDNNDPLCYSPDNVRECYEYLICRKMPNLKILNQNQVNIGTRSYLHYLHSKLFDPLSRCTRTDTDTRTQEAGLNSKVALMLKQRSFMNILQKDKDREKHYTFCESDQFVQHKSVGVASDLIQITNFLSVNNGMYLCSFGSIYSKYDSYIKRVRRCLHLLTSQVIRIKYKQKKRMRYFEQNRPLLHKLLKQVLQLSKNYGLYRVIGKFRSNQKHNNGQIQAVKIQKTWRMYSVRKKYLAIRQRLRKTKVQKDEDSQFADFDQELVDFFDQQIVPVKFELKIPETLVLNVPRQIPRLEQPAVSAQPTSLKQLPPTRGEMMMQNNNFLRKTGQSVSKKAPKPASVSDMESSSTSSFRPQPLPPISKKAKMEQEIERIMREFGYSNRETAVAQYNAMQKTLKMKQKTKDKNSEQRLNEFHKSSNRR